jgi:hypothetical protein
MQIMQVSPFHYITSVVQKPVVKWIKAVKIESEFLNNLSNYQLTKEDVVPWMTLTLNLRFPTGGLANGIPWNW